MRTFDRDDGSEGRVSNLTLGDETGRIRVTLWDDRADRADELDAGAAVEIIDGYVRERDGSLELHVGDQGAVDEVDDDVAFEPDADPIAEVELEETVDIAGGVARQTGSARSTATTAPRGRSETSASRTAPAISGSRSGATRPTRTLHRGTRCSRRCETRRLAARQGDLGDAGAPRLSC